MPIHFELVTPERVVFRQEIDIITLPTESGEVTILPNHIPLVSALVPGVVHLKKGKLEEDVAVSGGFIEVMPESSIRVLADTAERGFELKLDVIEKAKARAEKLMNETIHSNDAQYAAAAAALEREIVRYKVARKHIRGPVPTIDKAILPDNENTV